MQYHHTVSPYSITIQHHYTVSPYSIATQYHHTASPYSITIQYRHTVSPYSITIQYNRIEWPMTTFHQCWRKVHSSIKWNNSMSKRFLLVVSLLFPGGKVGWLAGTAAGAPFCQCIMGCLSVWWGGVTTTTVLLEGISLVPTQQGDPPALLLTFQLLLEDLSTGLVLSCLVLSCLVSHYLVLARLSNEHQIHHCRYWTVNRWLRR